MIKFVYLLLTQHLQQFMFKKKAKRQQGVLDLDQDPETHPIHQADQHQPLATSSLPNQTVPHTHKKQDQPNQPLQAKKNQLQAVALEPSPNHQPVNLKRGKNFQGQRPDDEDEEWHNDPQKRVKLASNIQKQKALISSSTADNNQRLSEAVHAAFDDVNYRAGKSLIKDLALPADQLEEEVAKKRFLQNVERTRLVKEGKLQSKIYKGMNAYANHKLTKDEIANAEESYKKKMGPSRVNSTIQNSCRFDYVLNLCKDWHDSGYCPFGDSCLYLHDRSNLKTGWELEKDFQKTERERWRRINNPELAQKEDRQKLLKTIQKYKPQESCPMCSNAFVSPVEVECGHIYCTACALKITKCKECGKRLGGIMNNAAGKLAQKAQSYLEMVAKLDCQSEESMSRRRKFQDCDALDVFND